MKLHTLADRGDDGRADAGRCVSGLWYARVRLRSCAHGGQLRRRLQRHARLDSDTRIAFTRRDAPYAVVDLARSGAAIRSSDSTWRAWVATPCPTRNFWRTRLAEANAKIATDAYVVDLGINDTEAPGTPTSSRLRGISGEDRLDDAPVRRQTRDLDEPAVRDRAARPGGGLRHRERVAGRGDSAVARPHPHRLGGRSRTHTPSTCHNCSAACCTRARAATAWASIVVAATDQTLRAQHIQ